MIPDGYDDLLTRPLFGHLASLRPDGAVQVSPMWFDWDGAVLRFTHTSRRQRYRNMLVHRQLALSISDPQDPYRYLELRGTAISIDADPRGEFFNRLARRYGHQFTEPPSDASVRVIVVMQPTTASIGVTSSSGRPTAPTGSAPPRRGTPTQRREGGHLHDDAQ